MNPLNRLVGELIKIDERRYKITDYELVDQDVLLHATALDEPTGIIYVSLPEALNALFSADTDSASP
jgi:hypothetical protein